jgi:TrmH family RNA methyltransferase
MSPAITSTANPRVQAWLRLRDRRGRDETGRTLVDGAREIGRALAAGVPIEELVVRSGAIDGAIEGAPEGAPDILRRIRIADVPIVEVSDHVAERLAFGDRADGLVAVVRIPDLRLERLALSAEPLVVVLEGLEKPGNLGAVLRSADGAGADAVIAADPRTDLFNPNAIRASLGTIFAVPVAAAPSAAVADWCRAHELRIVAARVDAATTYTETDLTGPLALVLGAETAGLGEVWTAADVVAVRLPMRGIADSLNVSAAAAILLYEARRQRDDRGSA